MHDTAHREVVQANGLVLGSAINCAVLVLLNAGIAMRGVLVATTCVVFDNGNRRTR
jgi:ribonuclease PH